MDASPRETRSRNVDHHAERDAQVLGNSRDGVLKNSVRYVPSQTKTPYCLDRDPVNREWVPWPGSHEAVYPHLDGPAFFAGAAPAAGCARGVSACGGGVTNCSVLGWSSTVATGAPSPLEVPAVPAGTSDSSHSNALSR